MGLFNTYQMAGRRMRDSRRTVRSHVLYWWPTVLVVLIVAWLWLLGERKISKIDRVAQYRELPEPDAAFVTLPPGAQSLYLKSDIFTSPSGLGFGRLRDELGSFETIAATTFQPPEFLPTETIEPRPVKITPPPITLPSIAEFGSDKTAIEQPLPAPSNSLQIATSAGLQKAHFAFNLNRTALPVNAAGHVRCFLELDHDGRVAHLLIEKDDMVGDVRDIEAAVSQGRGNGAASGMVDITW